MRATVKDKEKGATSAVTRQQPLKYSESPSLTPKRQRPGILSSGDADLQRKMKDAAMEFVEIYQEFSDAMAFGDEALIIPPGTSFQEAYTQHQTHMWGNCLYCTPGGVVMYRLDDEWIKVTAENVAKVCREIEPDLPPEFCVKTALRILKEAKRWAKEYGRVGWVF